MNHTSPICNGGTALAGAFATGGTPPYAYTWTNESGLLYSGENNEVVFYAGYYTVAVVDSNRCTTPVAAYGVTISQPGMPLYVITSTA